MRFANTVTLLLAMVALPALATPLTPYDATYKVVRKGKTYGVATRELRQQGQQYVLTNKSDIHWLIFSDQRNEKATFTVHDGQVQAQRYEYSRKGTGSDEHYNMQFAGGVVSSDGGTGVHFKGVAYDPLSYQQQLALDLAAGKKDVSFDLYQELKHKHYRFKVLGEERLSTPYGEVDTIRVERVRSPNSSRKTLFWLAPSLNYALVKLWQGKNGSEQMELVLSDFKSLHQQASLSH